MISGTQSGTQWNATFPGRPGWVFRRKRKAVNKEELKADHGAKADAIEKSLGYWEDIKTHLDTLW